MKRKRGHRFRCEHSVLFVRSSCRVEKCGRT